MQKKGIKKSAERLEAQAISIASEIFNLLNQYTNDSATSKFFLNDEISASFYVAAGGFTSLVYVPPLEAEEIKNKHAVSFFFILATYGFQVYLKERSIKTNAAPFRLPTNETLIEDASIKILDNAEEGKLISSPLSDAVINIIIKQIEKTMNLKDFEIKDHALDEKKLFSYMLVTLYYGYNMAVYIINKSILPQKTKRIN